MMTAPTAAIRVAGVDDLDAVLHLHTEQGSRRAGPASQQERQTWKRMLGMPDLRVYLALLNGEVVGTATAMEMPNVTYDCAPTLFVEAVVVTATHRRRGIATAMMNRILDDARNAGCDKVQLLSHKRHADDGAHVMYRKLGFSAEAEGFRLYLREPTPRGSDDEAKRAPLREA